MTLPETGTSLQSDGNVPEPDGSDVCSVLLEGPKASDMLVLMMDHFMLGEFS